MDFIKNNLSMVLGGLLAASVIAFSLTRNPVFAVSGFLLLIAMVLRDLTPSKWNSGEIKKTALELGIALGLALGVWIGLQLLLSSQAPIDVVTSCSMLPNLERGDMIVVRGGIKPDSIKATEIRFTGTLESLNRDLRVVKAPCQVKVSGISVEAACTQSIVYKGEQYAQDPSSDIVVFDATPRFYGLVVHRVFAKVTNGTHTFLLTKGDNNIGIDQEAGFSAVSQEDVKGFVQGRIPLIGFLKLFLYMQFEEPQGCKQVLEAGE